MITVIFSVARLGLGRIAGAAIGLAGRLPQRKPFELSEDGEFLYSSGERYDFVGFSEDGSYVSDSGELASPGRRLGYVVNDSGRKVTQLDCGDCDYVMVSGAIDCAEIYRLCM